MRGVHPHAETFRAFSAEELDRLAEDIAENGLRDPITLTPDGLILDGRNRLAACERVCVKPRFEVTEDDPGTVVRSRNGTRRHQTTGQLAMSTGMSLVLDGKRRDGKWAYGSVERNGSVTFASWAQRLVEVGFVLDHAPDLAVPVRDGDQALDAAYRQAVANRDAERNRLAEAERLAAEEADARTATDGHQPTRGARSGARRAARSRRGPRLPRRLQTTADHV